MKGRKGETIELLSSGSAAGTPSAGADGGDTSGKLNKHRKLNIPVVVLMIIGKIVGGGLLLVPIALSKTGWFGFIVLLLCFVTSAFTGVILARSWLVLMRWYPDKYQDEINRHPYPSISYEAFGDAGRRVTAILIATYSFGFTVAIYLIVADSVQLFFELLHVQVSLCSLIAIAVLSSAPMLWLGTPKDMIIVGTVSGCTSLLGFLSLVIGSLLDIGVHPVTVPVDNTFFSVLGPIGLIMTAFSGQFIIPTIQHDMKNPEHMEIAAFLGYLGIGLLYATLGLTSFLVYGNLFAVIGTESIIDLITTGTLQVTAIAFISIHMLIAGVLINNPLFQDLENYFDIPYTITWKRVLMRSVFSILILSIALSVPSFSIYLSVIGGAIAAVVNGILPSVVYLKLSGMEPPAGKKPEGPLKWYFTLAIVSVIVVSAIGGLLSSISGIHNLFNNENNSTLPCYIHFH